MRKANVALSVPSAKEFYLAVREEYFLEHKTRQV